MSSAPLPHSWVATTALALDQSICVDGGVINVAESDPGLIGQGARVLTPTLPQLGTCTGTARSSRSWEGFLCLDSREA